MSAFLILASASRFCDSSFVLLFRTHLNPDSTSGSLLVGLDWCGAVRSNLFRLSEHGRLGSRVVEEMSFGFVVLVEEKGIYVRK